MFEPYTYTPTRSILLYMSPEEAQEHLERHPQDALEVLRAVFAAGMEYQGSQSCGCC